MIEVWVMMIPTSVKNVPPVSEICEHYWGTEGVNAKGFYLVHYSIALKTLWHLPLIL